MKRIFFFTCLMMLMHQGLFAQPGSPKIRSLPVENDTAYTRFRAQVDAVIKKAKARNTNIAEARLLFSQNKSLLQKANLRLKQSGKINNVQPMNARLLKVNAELLKLAKVGQALLPASMKPLSSFSYSTLANGSTISLLKNDLAIGEIHYTVDPEDNWGPTFKDVHQGFYSEILVPNDATIIAARVHFDWEFYYTGWDTYGANNGIQLVVGVEKNKFISPGLNAMDSVTFNPLYFFYHAKFKILDILLPLDSITTDVAEVHAEKQGSFTMDGYVTPGTKIKFYIAPGYMAGSVYGINGHYLYGEFRLKKATVAFLKSAD
jgi:hypothetical protein